MSEKIYPKGLRTFKPNENAPDFVKGTLIITPSELVQFCEEKKELMTDYKGTPQLKCQILEGDKGIYFVVDTYKSEPTQKAKEVQKELDLPEAGDLPEDLPF